MILNVVLVGALVASYESDQIEVPLNHVMEDADWVHNIWTTITGFTWRYANMAILLFMLGDQGNKITML